MTIPSRLSEALSDRYSIERELGEGGMASVYLADDIRHGRKVALKVLKPELAAIVGGDRFLLEIRTTANLSHPHILPLFDSGEAGGLLYYVMPYVEGESLRERLDREKQLPVDEALAIVTKVAGALQSAHDKGIVHRDIKPENILLAGGEPLVADFGIALAVQQAGGGRLTETGLSLGTPYYMSPEQATADRDPDARADVYSLGCVLYEMLTGEPPFTGTTAQAVLGRILTQTAPSVTENRPSVPPHVDAVIHHALEKLPADRFATPADFAAALVDASGTSRWTGSTAGVGAGAPSPTKRAARMLPWAVAGVATLVAVTLAVRPRVQAPSAEPIRFGIETGTEDWGRGALDLAISADGRNIVFGSSVGGRIRLYRRSLGDTEIHPISGTEGAMWIGISPDSRWVAFTTPDGRVKRVPLDGGPSVVMANTTQAPIGLAWSDDTHLVMGMLAYSPRYPGLTGVAIGDTALKAVTDSVFPSDQWSAGFMRHEPFSLGDGNVLYIDFDDSIAEVGLGVASLADGKTRRLDFKGAAVRRYGAIVGVADGVLLFVGADDRLMAVTWDPARDETVGEPAPVPGVPGGVGLARVAPNGTLVLALKPTAYHAALVDDRGTVERFIGDTTAAFNLVRFSPDGRRAVLASSSSGESANTWIYNIGTGLLSQLSLGIVPWGVTWSPDGRRILAYERPRRDTRFVSRAADASDEAKEVLHLPNDRIVGMTLGPDGKTLALVKNPDASVERYDVVTATLGGDSATTPFAAGPANEVVPRFSPDGRFLAYASDESGRYEVYVRPFPGPGARAQISDDGGGQPTWSGDGKRIFYRTGKALIAANLDVDPRAGMLSVTKREQLFEANFRGSASSDYTTYDAAPDGKHFLVIRADAEGRTEVWTNWIGELKKSLKGPEG